MVEIHTMCHSNSMKAFEIGTAKSESGELSYGCINGIELFIGGTERFTLIMAQGNEEESTLFLSVNVHSNELTGVAVIHDIV